MIAGICRFPRLPCPSTTLHVMLNLTSATSTGVYHTGTSALYVCSLLLWLTTNNTTTTYVGILLLLEKWWKRVVFGCSSSLLHCFSTAAAAAAAAAAVGGAASFCTYTNILFHFPFDEIYLSASSPLSAFLLLLLLLLLLLVVLLPSVRIVYTVFFFIFRLMRYTSDFFHSRAFCFRVNRLFHN